MIDSEFGFRGYSPTWIPFTEAEPHARALFSHALGHSLVDITGVQSSYGWEPDWPIILTFQSISIAMNTKSDSLWSLDRWEDWAFDEAYGSSDSSFPLRHVSVLDDLGLRSVVGKTLMAVYARPLSRIEEFLLVLNEHGLIVGNGGDQLLVELHVPRDCDTSSWSVLCQHGTT